MAVSDWSGDPNANANVPGIDIPEFCNARNINDAIRQVMADVANWAARPAVQGKSEDSTKHLLVADGSIWMAGNLVMAGHSVTDIPYPTSFQSNNAVPASWIDSIYQRKGIDLLNYLYPIGVGPIIITMFNVNPGTWLGGAWVNVGTGRFPVSAGVGTDSRGEARGFGQGEQGGEYNHVLTIPEMPSHNHPTNRSFGVGSGGNDTGAADAAGPRTSGAVGAGQPHNNVPPYFAVYFWQRVG